MGLPRTHALTPIREQQAQAERAERLAETAERNRVFALQSAMQHKPTRALLRWLLTLGKPEGSEMCPIDETFNSNAMQMAHAEGVRLVKARLWQELATHAPAELVLLQQEGKEP